MQPSATPAGGSEIGFPVDGDATIRSMHAHWSSRGIALIQAPTRMDFGYTFVAVDPDGHRLRVFAPSEA